jgi:hypothetical protein
MLHLWRLWRTNARANERMQRFFFVTEPVSPSLLLRRWSSHPVRTMPPLHFIAFSFPLLSSSTRPCPFCCFPFAVSLLATMCKTVCAAFAVVWCTGQQTSTTWAQGSEVSKRHRGMSWANRPLLPDSFRVADSNFLSWAEVADSDPSLGQRGAAATNHHATQKESPRRNAPLLRRRWILRCPTKDIPQIVFFLSSVNCHSARCLKL